MPIDPSQRVPSGASNIGSASVARLNNVDPPESHSDTDAERDRPASDAVFREIVVSDR
jgi:hypothetical protein